ncbi:MAG: hypothetical protein AB1351_13000 [Thermoproteota archaeon]
MENRVRSKCVANELVTLADISPSWSMRLQNLPGSKWSFRWLRWYSDITSPENCIVGEAHGRSSSYWYDCVDCREFSRRFPRYFGRRSYKELDDDVQRFVVHWNEKHADSKKKQKDPRWYDGIARFDDYIQTYR